MAHAQLDVQHGRRAEWRVKMVAQGGRRCKSEMALMRGVRRLADKRADTFRVLGAPTFTELP